jgi:hypothetical protein
MPLWSPAPAGAGVDERAAAGKRQPADDEQPNDDPPHVRHAAASCASTLTFRLPSAFIATADQWPFSTGQVMVCVPVPVACARQMLCVAGSAGGAPAPTRR